MLTWIEKCVKTTHSLIVSMLNMILTEIIGGYIYLLHLNRSFDWYWIININIKIKFIKEI